MDDFFDNENKDLTTTDGKAYLLAKITENAQFLDENQIKVKFNLTDEQMQDTEIQAAIKKGEILAVEMAGRALLEQARDGKLSAIKMLFEINKGKQAPKNYSFDYKSKDQQAIENAEKIGGGNIFAALAS